MDGKHQKFLAPRLRMGLRRGMMNKSTAWTHLERASSGSDHSRRKEFRLARKSRKFGTRGEIVHRAERSHGLVGSEVRGQTRIPWTSYRLATVRHHALGRCNRPCAFVRRRCRGHVARHVHRRRWHHVFCRARSLNHRHAYKRERDHYSQKALEGDHGFVG